MFLVESLLIVRFDYPNFFFTDAAHTRCTLASTQCVGACEKLQIFISFRINCARDSVKLRELGTKNGERERAREGESE